LPVPAKNERRLNKSASSEVQCDVIYLHHVVIKTSNSLLSQTIKIVLKRNYISYSPYSRLEMDWL